MCVCVERYCAAKIPFPARQAMPLSTRQQQLRQAPGRCLALAERFMGNPWKSPDGNGWV